MLQHVSLTFLMAILQENLILNQILEDFGPIADKILVVSILIILIANHLIVGVFVYPALVIILREIIVSGLRDFFTFYKNTFGY